jgi:transcriptional regulator with XRE-family HTH domain
MRDQSEQIDPALEIGARLAVHRTRRAMKVSELARHVGVSPSLISQIERGQSRPSVSTLFGLAEALDVRYCLLSS